MNNNCHPIEELAEIAELKADDPGRRHFDACPRCQARLETYEEFMRAEGECDPDQLDKAVDRLGAQLDHEIFGADSSTQEKHDPAEQNRSIIPFQSPYFRSALALAACLLLFFALDGIWDRTGQDSPEPDNILLRSEGSGPLAGTVTLDEPHYLADGGIELKWQPHTDADTYLVKILNAQLDEVARLPAGTDTSLRIGNARLHELLPSPGSYAWVVFALSEGDEVARSQPSSFRFGPNP